MKKIIQIVNTLSVSDGGPARNSLELNKYFNETTWGKAQLYWINGEIADSLVPEVWSEGSEWPTPIHLHEKVKAKRRIQNILRLLKEIQGSDVVIVHGYYMWWVPLALIFSKILGSRTLIMPHGALTARQQRYSVKRKKIFDFFLSPVRSFCLDSFVTGSDQELDDISEKFPGTLVQVAGVGVSPVHPRDERLPIHRPIRLLSLSRIAAKKRIDRTIRATSILRNQGVEVELLIAGNGDPELVTELEELVSELNLNGTVTFLGSVTGQDKVNLYQSVDFYILPSEDENFGISFAEAVSYGLVAIASDEVAAAKNLPALAGRVLTDVSPSAISSAIIELSDPEEFLSRSQAARSFAAEEYSWHSIVKRWKNIVDRVSLDG